LGLGVRLKRDLNLGSFLAQEIEIGVASGACINDGRKIAREIVSVAATDEGKSKRELQDNLRLAY
jgi:hypothetical protein